MKKFLLTLVLMVGVVLGLFAQNLTYQAVIRDNSQQLVVNTDVKATVTITFTTGTPTTYVETVEGSTNLHGLLSFEFGDATLLGRDWTGATIAVKVVKANDEGIVYVNDDARSVSAVPYALSVNGQSIQNYLTEHNYVDLDKLNDTLNAYPTTAVMDGRHYLTSDSAVIGTMKSNIATNASNLTTLQGTLQQLTNQLNVQIAKLDSIAHIVDSLSKLPHGGGEDKPCPSSVSDVDGNSYNTVKIGSQCWMAKNLKTTTKRNSVGNINVRTKNSNTYYYYDWAAVMQNESGDKVRGICPEGWHVPSKAEWEQLTSYVSSQSEYVCGSDNGNIAKALASATGWCCNQSYFSGCNPGNKGDEANATGFSALPAGSYHDHDSTYYGTDDNVDIWSATDAGNSKAWYFNLQRTQPNVTCPHILKSYGISVRCLMD